MGVLIRLAVSWGRHWANKEMSPGSLRRAILGVFSAALVLPQGTSYAYLDYPSSLGTSTSTDAIMRSLSLVVPTRPNALQHDGQTCQRPEMEACICSGSTCYQKMRQHHVEPMWQQKARNQQ